MNVKHLQNQELKQNKTFPENNAIGSSNEMPFAKKKSI